MTDGAAKGTLVLGYRTAEEQKAWTEGHAGMGVLRAMIERWEVKGEVDFGATPRLPYRIEGAPPDATPVALLDVDHTFWETFQGQGQGRSGEGTAGGGTITLKAAPARPPRPEPCAGDRRRLITIDAPGLPGSPRRFCAWLPPSWEAKPARRYPMVWMFPGLFSRDTSYLRGKQHVGTRFDALSAEIGREAILVGVDTSSPEGSTYLEGAWDTFLATTALPRLTTELHARPESTARALIGQSTGGFNALSYGLRHPDLFSAIGASSPDPADFEAWLLEPGTRRARSWVKSWLALESAVGGPGQMRSWAAAWSPDPSAPLGVRWPFDPKTGEANEEALSLWVAKSPHGFLRNEASVARARSLRGRIAITVGRKDEFDLFTPAERIAKELTEHGLDATFQPTDSGHGDQDERLLWLLRFLVPRLDAASPQNRTKHLVLTCVGWLSGETLWGMGLLNTRWEARYEGHNITVSRNEFTRGFMLEWDGREIARRAWSFVGLGELHGTAEHDGKPIDLRVTLSWGEGLLTDGECTIEVDGKPLSDIIHVR